MDAHVLEPSSGACRTFHVFWNQLLPFHVSMFPCFHVSMFPYFHVSMFPCAFSFKMLGNHTGCLCLVHLVQTQIRTPRFTCASRAEQDIKKWLRTDFTHLHEPARHEGRLTMRSVSLGVLAGKKLERMHRFDMHLASLGSAKQRGNSKVVPFECSQEQEADIAACLEHSSEWHWDIFTLSEKCGGRELQVIMHPYMHAFAYVSLGQMQSHE
jgi:hypothetical protein